MKLRPASILLAALLASTATAAQTVDVPVLLRTGDVLPDGSAIEDIQAISQSEAGEWLALVITDQGGFEEDGALLVNGTVVLREGTALPNGEVIGQILGADLASDGTRAWAHRLDPFGTSRDEALYVDGVEVLRTGETITGAGLLGGAEVRDLSDLRIENDRVLIVMELLVGGTALEGLVEVTLGTGGGPTYRLLAREDQTPAALSGPIRGFFDELDLAEDGTFAAVVSFDAASGAIEKAVLTDQGWRAVQGTPGPVAGMTWLHSGVIEVAAAPGGGILVSSDLDDGAGGNPGVVLGPGGVLAFEGDAFGPAPTEIVSFFSGKPLDVGAGGELAWVAPIASFDDVLVVSGSPRLRESTTQFEGEAPASSLASSATPALSIARGGRQVLLVSFTAAGDEVVGLYETELGFPDGGCMAVPNSTGSVGRTRAFGSSVASANDLTVECSSLPPQQFALLIAASGRGFIPGAGGSPGNLCLGGIFGRLNGTLAAIDASGVISSPVDVAAIPQGVTTVAVQPGETWYFQRWHRDVVGGVNTSNFTASVGVTFR